MSFVKRAVPFLIGIGLWLVPVPEGLSSDAWQLFAIFIATISGIIIRPFPMPATAIIGVTAVVLSKTLTLEQALSGFSRDVIWLIVVAYFVAHGIIKTGLGNRISYFFMMILGKKTLGLTYGLAGTNLTMAPAIPSSTARAGGVLLPIVESLSLNYESKPRHPSMEKIGSYLLASIFQINTIADAMFLTAMSANPLTVEIARDMGIDVTWGSWFLAASVPGIVSLIVIPLMIYLIHPPKIKETPHASKIAKEHLKHMGKVKIDEWIMLGVFVLLITLWMIGPDYGIKAATTGFLGLSILLLTRVLSWQELVKESEAWSTLVWFAVLLMMASQLNKLGFTPWFGDLIVGQVEFLSWQPAFILLALIYFYTHYLFAGNISHVGAMLPTFLMVAIKLGTPPYLAVYTLGFFSALFGGLTHYGSGPSAVLYGAGFVKIRDWWLIGFTASVINIAIWLVIGGAWWKLLGIW